MGPPCAGKSKTSVEMQTAPWAHHCHAPPAMYVVHKVGATIRHRARRAPGRSTQTAWGTWGARGVPKQRVKELVQRKGRTKAELSRQQQTMLRL